MAGWRKHFKASNLDGNISPINNNQFGTPAAFGIKNYQSRLPDVYIGHPNRIERYNSYEQMDADSEVNAALDILAEFSTQLNTDNNTPFNIIFNENPTDNEIKIVKEQLRQWCRLNELNKRIFKLFRNTLKYGDQVFIRDPENFKLMWSEMSKVIKVIVNESDGKSPEQYVVKDINPNLQNLTVTAVTTSDTYSTQPQNAGGVVQYNSPSSSNVTGGRFQNAPSEAVINAEHVMHLSLSEGLDANWPFGTSVLETIFKVFKQKELLEDAVLIYRIQRAPERRVFKIDVGNMPSHLAMAFVERVKNEVHQRRMPSQSGSGGSMMDATYNPISMNEDFFFPQAEGGRGSSVEVLPGGTQLGEITDLRFFTNKMFRGLRIPSSYLPTQTDEASNNFSDGKVGIAQIQEWRFNQYCTRMQNLIVEPLNKEFKMFLRFRGINIDSKLFDIKFNEPQNFTSYRQAGIDMERIQVFSQIEPIPYMSKRFIMKRYLGMTTEEMQENEEMWAEEHAESGIDTSESPTLRSVGVTSGSIGSDMASAAPMDMEGGDDLGGAEGGPELGGDMGGGDASSVPPPAPAGPGIL